MPRADRTKNNITPNGEPAPPCLCVIFGATGDLAERKLAPALYNLRRDGFLPDHFAVLGLATRDISTDELRDKLLSGVRKLAGSDVDERIAAWLGERVQYRSSDFNDTATYAALADDIAKTTAQFNTQHNVLFYLSTPPRFFEPIAEQLQQHGLLDESAGWRRLIVEKPFGRDHASAVALNTQLTRLSHEDQIYRIDHYLGKETVQNIELLRFANGIFEPIWNRQFIDHVQITVAEAVSVGSRAKYYDQSGALRDMAPNHLFQLLALTAMEAPASLAPHAVRTEKAKLFDAVVRPKPSDVDRIAVRGQYGPGTADGAAQVAYRNEANIPDDSPTETYFAFELAIENWRWIGVPFYLRSGKCLPARATEIVVQFKRPPLTLFETGDNCQVGNQLVLRLQPREGIGLFFNVKQPGPQVRMQTVSLDFCYADYFGVSPSTGYETLLYDCMRGDATLFQRADHVESCWEVVDPILQHWAETKPSDFPNYAAGSWGPQAADALLGRTGRAWRVPGGVGC